MLGFGRTWTVTSKSIWRVSWNSMMTWVILSTRWERNFMDSQWTGLLIVTTTSSPLPKMPMMFLPTTSKASWRRQSWKVWTSISSVLRILSRRVQIWGRTTPILIRTEMCGLIGVERMVLFSTPTLQANILARNMPFWNKWQKPSVMKRKPHTKCWKPSTDGRTKTRAAQVLAGLFRALQSRQPICLPAMWMRWEPICR